LSGQKTFRQHLPPINAVFGLKRKEKNIMKGKELKKILTGLSLATLLAGSGAISIGYVDAQGG